MVLYNKYRPTTLKNLCGQEHIRRNLENEVARNEIANAYLFTGPAGTGKTTCARILAAMVNCSTGMTIDPPMSDPFVSAIMSRDNEGSDVYQLDAASKRGIDEAKKLREMVSYPPMEMRKRVMIIDECHQLTPEAWSVLLKMIEEPPSYALFILCTTETQKVLDTIKTRCECFSFLPIQTFELQSYIKDIANKEHISIDDNGLSLIAASAGGSLREALSNLGKARNSQSGSEQITEEMVSKIVGLPSRKLIRDFLREALTGDIGTGLAISAKAIGNGVTAHDFLVGIGDAINSLFLHGRKNIESIGRFGYTPDDITDVSLLQKQIVDLVGKNHVFDLLFEWLKVIDRYDSSTTMNPQPQQLINVTLGGLFLEYRKFRLAFLAQNKTTV